MSVVSVNELTNPRAWKTRDGRGYTRVYKVILDDPTDGAAVARTADDGSTAVPDIGDAYPSDSSADVVRVDPMETGSRLIFDVRVDYETPGARGPGDDERSDDPLSDPVKVSWGSWTETRAVIKDRDGNPIVNSANFWFDPPVEETFHHPMVTITRNVSSYDPDDADEYIDTVNADSLTIAGLTVAAGTAKLVRWDADNNERNGTEYFTETYEVWFKPGGWARELLDQGYYEIVDGEPQPYSDARGDNTLTLMRLDGSGNFLAPTASLTSSVFGSFDILEEKHFSALNLPTTADGDR